MSTCSNCGAETMGRFCSECGASQLEVQEQTVVNAPPYPAQDLQPSQNLPTVLTAPPIINREYDVAIPVAVVVSRVEQRPEHTMAGTGAFILNQSDERPIWSGKPAPMIAIKLGVVWGAWVSFTVLLAILLGGGWFWVMFWMFCAGVSIGLYTLALTRMNYNITTQRIEVSDGLLHHQMRTYEVHELGDATIDSPFPLSFLGLSMLTIQHRNGRGAKLPPVRTFHRIPENYTPTHITVLGIPTQEARTVRDFLRETGQREASRWDKLQVR